MGCRCGEIRGLEEYIAELEDKLDKAIVPDLSPDRVQILRDAWPKIQPGALRLLLLMYDARKLMTKADLEAALPSPDASKERSTKIIDVHVCNARKVIGADKIKTAWGNGYTLTEAGRSLIENTLREGFA